MRVQFTPSSTLLLTLGGMMMRSSPLWALPRLAAALPVAIGKWGGWVSSSQASQGIMLSRGWGMRSSKAGHPRSSEGKQSGTWGRGAEWSPTAAVSATPPPPAPSSMLACPIEYIQCDATDSFQTHPHTHASLNQPKPQPQPQLPGRPSIARQQQQHQHQHRSSRRLPQQ